MAVQLRALGECVIETDVARFGPEARYAFASALYLTLERGKRVPRQALIDLLWPDVKDDKHARHRFRQNLLRLRQLGVPVQSQQGHVTIGRDAVGADFDPVFESANGEAAEVLRARASSGFLPGYSPTISAEFTSWLELHRSRVNIALQRAFVHEIQAARVRGDWTGVEQLSVECLRLDPFHEEATMARAEAAVMRGSKVQALAILDAYMEALGDNSVAIGLPAKILRSRIAERVHEPRYVALSERHFVGREAEVEQLTHMLDEAKAGRGGSCLITGEPGIGKTRLIQEMTNIAEMKGIRVVVARCQPTDVDRPLSVFADTVPVLQALPGALGVHPQTLAVLSRITRRPTVDSVSPSAGPTDVFAAVRGALFDLIDSILSEVPLVFVLDDAQWLDGSSREVVSVLTSCAERRRLVVLKATRPPPVDPGQSLSQRVVVLSPLRETTAASLANTLASDSGAAMSQDMIEWCASVSEGNPYHLRELVSRWLEKRDSFRATPALVDLVSARVAGLSGNAQQLLRLAVVLGRYSTVQRLGEAIEMPPHEFLSAIDELARASVIRTGAVDVIPRHDLIRQATLDSCSTPLLAALHRRAALVLEKEAVATHDAAIGWACAQHWRHAGDSRRAIETVTTLVRYLVQLGLAREARSLASSASELAASTAERAEALGAQLLSCRAMGDYSAARRVIDELRSIREEHEHDDLELIDVEVDLRTYTATRVPLERLLGCVRDASATDSHRAQAAYLAVSVAAVDAVYDQIKDIRGIIERLLDSADVAECVRSSLAMAFHTECGDPTIACATARMIRQHLPPDSPPWEILRSLRNAGFVQRRVGDANEAYALEIDAYKLSDRYGMADAAIDCAEELATHHLQLDDVDGARTWCARAHEWVPRAQQRDGHHITAYIEARIALHEGAVHRAEEVFAECIRERGDGHVIPHIRRRVVHRSVCIALQTAAQRISHELLGVFEEEFLRIATSGMTDFSALSLLNAHVATGNRKHGRDLIERYVQSLRRDALPVYPPLAAALRRL